VAAAFRAAGAVSPATARPLNELPPFDAGYLATLIDRGVVREGPEGRFYHYAHTGRPRRALVLRALLYVVGILGLPIVCTQFSGAGRTP
jgi:hypothetical protein